MTLISLCQFAGLSLGRPLPFGVGGSSVHVGMSVVLQTLSEGPVSRTNREDHLTLYGGRPSSKKSLVDVLLENVMLREVFSLTSTTKAGLSQDFHNTSHWDAEAGVNMRTLEESSPATAVEGTGANGEEISVPSQLQTLPPGAFTSWRDKLFSLLSQVLFIYLCMYWGGGCLFAFRSLHICITFFSLLHNTIQGLAAGK